MCGIIAGISDSIVEILIEGLKQLQNRGYDSAGIGYISNEHLKIVKKASTENTNAIEYLEKYSNSNSNSNSSKIGIGHTRWATHGGKTDINSHPHISYDGKFALVHNGIIENYLPLREKLMKAGIAFASETDTEVIVNLLAYNYSLQTNNKCVESALQETTKVLEGTWGLVIVHLEEPNTLFCTRVGSPLLVGVNDNIAIVTSEQSGFCGHINNYTILKNRDICVISYQNGEIVVKTNEKNYQRKKVLMRQDELSPAPFKHWMLKEIYEQVDSVKRVIKQGSRILDSDKVHLGGLNENKETLLGIDHLVLLGCGTSLNAAKFAIHYFKLLCGFSSVIWMDGADFGSNDISPCGNTALILLSQSGETKDLHRCIEIADEHNLFTIGVVNVVDSLIAREVDCGCYLHAGREVAVASTKSFTSQCILLVMIAVWFSQIQEPRIKKSVQRKHIIRDLRNLSDDLDKSLECHDDIKKTDHSLQMLVLAFYSEKVVESMAHEGALKIKSLLYSQKDIQVVLFLPICLTSGISSYFISTR